MNDPKVSFVIPCYNLAHFLPECVNSILGQWYQDFEILIMDDCSPDKTAEVSRTFNDPRVKYIRNEHNLGPLRNYNKGIRLAKGQYIWLISADDYLRSVEVLAGYVNLMDAHPEVGYCCCPGMGVRNGRETGVWDYSVYGKRDCIVGGHTFLQRLLDGNIVLAPAALARRKCYEQLSFFPVDVEWAGNRVDFVWGGDWYLWCLFALFFDVGYFAEPMVCYREHELSMTNTVTTTGLANCAAAEIAVLWMIKQRADHSGLRAVSTICADAIARQYARHLASNHYRWMDRVATSSISLEQFQESLCRSTQNGRERRRIRAGAFLGAADIRFYQNDLATAKQYYLRSLSADPLIFKVYLKLLMLHLGGPGDALRRYLRTCLPRREQ